MKKSLLLGLGAVAMAFAAGAGVTKLSTPKFLEEKEASAATNDKWYYRGTDTTKSAAGWGASTEGLYLVEGGEAQDITFKYGEQFKFAKGDNSEWFPTTFAGFYADYFYVSGNICTQNLLEGSSITINVRIIGSTLILGTTGYYTGDDSSKASWGNAYTAKPLVVNGPAQTMSFAVNEGFKVVRAGGNYTNAITGGGLASNYYKCFSGSGDGNIVAKYASTYDVSLVFRDGAIKLNVEAHDPTVNTAYALDLFNQKFTSAAKAHYFYKYNIAESQYEIGTDWTGVTMSVASGRIYQYSYWNVFTTVVFNDNGSNKTDDLTAQAGECFVLQSRSDWSGSWISLEAAQFIDENMLFNAYNESQYTEEITGDCATNYAKAKDAYNELSSNAVRLEVLSIPVVGERLNWWAKANSDTLDTDTGGIIAAAKLSLAPLESETNSTALIAVIMLSVAAVSVGGYLFLRKRKED